MTWLGIQPDIAQAVGHSILQRDPAMLAAGQAILARIEADPMAEIAAFRHRNRAQWQSARTRIVDGWLVTEQEAAVCACYAAGKVA